MKLSILVTAVATMTLTLTTAACSSSSKGSGEAGGPGSSYQVSASRVEGKVEIRVHSTATKKAGYAYDPALTVEGHTVRDYRFDDADRTIVFVEPQPESLPKADKVTLEWGTGAGAPPVKQETVPFQLDPSKL